MARKWGVTRATIFGSLIVHLDSSFGRKSPCPGPNSALTCPIFHSRTAGIASRSSPGLRTSVRPVRIAVVRLGSRHEVFDKIGALSIINFDPQ